MFHLPRYVSYKLHKRKINTKTDLLSTALGSDDLAENKQPASFCFTGHRRPLFTSACVVSPPHTLPPGGGEGRAGVEM